MLSGADWELISHPWPLSKSSLPKKDLHAPGDNREAKKTSRSPICNAMATLTYSATQKPKAGWYRSMKSNPIWKIANDDQKDEEYEDLNAKKD
jgi:hypothetical protein